jgi:hypothetical protein
MTVKVWIASAAALSLLVACGGPRGDWRAEVGRPTPNPRVIEPLAPLVIPAQLDLPPPG